MKKIVLVLFMVAVAFPASAKISVFQNGPGTPKWPILNSDVEEFKKILPTLDKEDLKSLGNYAMYICPTRSKNFFEPKDPICDEAANAEILRLIYEKAEPITSLEVEPLDTQVSYRINTSADRLAKHNAKALPYLLAKLDKCLIALSQMQEADDSKPNYYVYADYWREHKCNTKKYYMYPDVKNKQKKKLYSLIGKNKKAVEKAFGKPTVYEHPSEHREILTYKDLDTYKVGGDKGEQTSFYLSQWNTVFTIDRDVVTAIKRMKMSSTRGGEKTHEVTEEEREQRMKEEKMKNSAIEQTVMKVLFNGQNKQ